MATGTKTSWVEHLIGLALAGLLGLACYALYLYVPFWIRGTFLQSFGNLVTFVGVIAVLSVAELIWVFGMPLLRRRPPE